MRAHVGIATSTTSTATFAAPAAPSNNDMSAPTTAGEPMDIAAPASETNTNGNNTSPGTGAGQADVESDNAPNDRSKNASPPDLSNSGAHSILNMSAPPPAAAALHQPKIVQTAFIHKLYK